MILSKDTIIGEVLSQAEEMGCVDAVCEVFWGAGMHCLGCIAASGESIGEAAMVHGIDADNLMGALRDTFAAIEDAPGTN